MSKKAKSSTNMQNDSTWIKAIKTNDIFLPFVEELQSLLCTVATTVPLNHQIEDFRNNLAIPTEFPLVSVQINRISQDLNINGELNENLNKFIETISDQIQISEKTRLVIDPNCKSVRDYSSKINAYQQWLTKALFPLLCFRFNEQSLNNEIIEEYVILLNKIVRATTISRVKLRQLPDISSAILLDLAKNSDIKIYAEHINKYWFKAFLEHDGQTIHGYLQSAYVKQDS